MPGPPSGASDTPWAARVAASLLRLYPAHFRLRYGEEILAALVDDLQSHGLPRRWFTLFASLLNLISNALLLRLESLPESEVVMILKTPLAGDMELPMPQILISDLRFALRTLFRRPLGTLLIIATVALGVGVNTAMFSVVNGILLAPLPYQQADALVQVHQTDVANNVAYGGNSYPDFLDYRERQSVFTHLAAYTTRVRTLSGNDYPQLIQVTDASADLFVVLGISPLHGRLFSAEEEALNSGPVGVLNHAYWQRQFGGDPAIIGRIVDVDGESIEIIGVLPENARFPAGAQMLRPLQRELDEDLRGVHDLGVIARLAPDVLVDAADAQLRSIMQDLEQQYPEHNTGRGAAVRPLLGNTVRDVEDTLWLLMGAVVLILIITCANIANLLAARAESRRREVAIRCAVGASPFRLVKQFLTESVLLASLGGLAGIALAALAVEVLAAYAPTDLPRVEEIALDGSVLAFGLAITLLTGVLFGLLPARVAVRQQHAEDLKDGARGADSAGRNARRALVVTQIALAFVLVTGTTLLMRSLGKAGQVDPGFSSAGLVSAGISLPQSKYPWSWRDFPHGPAVMPFYDRLSEALQRQPALARFSLALQGPADPAWTSQIDVPNQGPDAPTAQQEEFIRLIDPDYLQTAGVALRAGRNFTASDRGDSVQVAMVNQAFVDKFFADRAQPAQVIGETLNFWNRDREIIAVIDNVRFSGVDQPAYPAVYAPLAQNPTSGFSIVAQARDSSAESINAALQALRTALAEVDPDIAMQQLASVDELLHGKLSGRRFSVALFSTFAVLAATLAFIGVYGVMSYLVSMRRFEFGVRLSFGATAADLLRDTFGRATGLCLLGLLIGFPIALAGAHALASELVQISSADPLSYLIVVCLMLIGVVLASAIPARRAAASDPLTALRAL